MGAMTAMLGGPDVIAIFAQAASGVGWGGTAIVAALGIVGLLVASGVRYIPNSKVGVVEKLWSGRGSVTEGRIVSLQGEAGLQVDVLRGGLHFGYWFFQYRVHLVRLVTVPQGKIAYVYARMASRWRRARRSGGSSRRATTSRTPGRS